MKAGILLTALSLGTSAVAQTNADLWKNYNYPDDVVSGNDVSPNIKVKDIVETTNDYSYASFGKPNPFVPPLVSTMLATMEIPIVSLLQRYELHQLKVTGIWTLANGERKALFLTPKDEGVIVQIGDPAGRKGGKVVRIEPNVVRVREFELAPDGTRQFEDYSLWLGTAQPRDRDTIVIKASRPGVVSTAPSGRDFLESRASEVRRQNLRIENIFRNDAAEPPPEPAAGQGLPQAPAGDAVPN